MQLMLNYFIEVYITWAECELRIQMLFKTEIKDAALTSLCIYNANLLLNLSDEEFEALQNLPKNTNLVIQK